MRNVRAISSTHRPTQRYNTTQVGMVSMVRELCGGERDRQHVLAERVLLACLSCPSVAGRCLTRPVPVPVPVRSVGPRWVVGGPRPVGRDRGLVFAGLAGGGPA